LEISFNLKKELKQCPDILNVAGSTGSPHDGSSAQQAMRAPDNPNESITLDVLTGDFDFVKTFGFEIIDGRDFSEEFQSDVDATILNQSAVKLLGYKKPVGDYVRDYKVNKIIGVIKDFNVYSYYRKIPPLYIIIGNTKYIRELDIRMLPGKQQEVIKYIQQIYDKHELGKINYEFFTDRIKNSYNEEANLGKIFNFFGMLSILISISGIWGVSLFTGQQKTKEIGIRKTNGAKTINLIVYLLKDFLIISFTGCIIAFPVTQSCTKNTQSFAMNKFKNINNYK